MNDLDHAGELLSMAGKDLKALRGMTDTDTFAEEVLGFHARQAVDLDGPPLDRQATVVSVQALFDRVRAVLASLEKK